MQHTSKTGLLLALVLSINTVWAGPLLQEDYPWPNLPSLTFASNGVQPGSGSLEWTYSNINPAEFDALWWTPAFLGVGLSGIASPMLSASLSVAGIATYLGSTTWNDPSHRGTDSVDTKIEIEIVGLSLVSIAPIEIMNANLSPGAFAIDVSGLTDFTIRFTATALNPHTLNWDPVNAFQQFSTPGNQSQTSVGATFFRSAPSTVPEPATLLLLGLGLFGLGFNRRKRSQ